MREKRGGGLFFPSPPHPPLFPVGHDKSQVSRVNFIFCLAQYPHPPLTVAPCACNDTKEGQALGVDKADDVKNLAHCSRGRVAVGVKGGVLPETEGRWRDFG